jgi:hypothetical protein
MAPRPRRDQKILAHKEFKQPLSLSNQLYKTCCFASKHNICSQSKKDSCQVVQESHSGHGHQKNILAIQTPCDDMMNRTGHIESSVSRHAAMITTRQINVI